MKEVFDYEPNNPVNEVDYSECGVCGAPIETNKSYCSRDCFNADLL